MKDDSTLNVFAGVRNLLVNCAGVKSGDRVLLVGEDTPAPYFSPELCHEVAATGQDLGFLTQTLFAPPVASVADFPEIVEAAMHQAEVTVFFSRLGDQSRFVALPGDSRKVMTYIMSRDHLGTPFATVDFAVTEQIRDRLVTEITAAGDYQISAPCGTRLRGRIQHRSDKTGNDAGNIVSAGDVDPQFSLILFPTMIFPPINCHQLDGELVISRFLTSTSTRAYDDSVLIVESPVTVSIENSRMVDFSGSPAQIRGIREHCEKAARVTGGDPYTLNSWHTGINPFTFFDGDPYSDLERWGTFAYGSPRYTHFHASGNDPGDTAIHLMDATISFDDRVVWDNGCFTFLDRPEIRAVLNGYGPVQESVYDIGL